jgi:hypothetical protein
MPKNYSEEIEDGVATMLWGEAWGAHVDEHECNELDDESIENAMPPPPDEAIEEAKRLIEAYEAANGVSVSVLYERALDADAGESVASDDDEPDAFGGDLVFMSLGTDMSWFDSHAKFPLEVPTFDNSALKKLADEQCDEGGAVA